MQRIGTDGTHYQQRHQVKTAINWLPNVRGRRRTPFWSQLLITAQLVVSRYQQAINGVISIGQQYFSQTEV